MSVRLPYEARIPPQHYLQASFQYDPDSGEVRHLDEEQVVKIRSKRQTIVIFKTRHALRRAIWVWMTGEEPKGPVYHRNGDWRDYRWENLTEEKPVTETRRRSQNKKRTKKDPKTGKPLPVGVNERGSKYYAIFTHKGQRYYSGICDTPEEAAEFYNAAVDIFLGTE